MKDPKWCHVRLDMFHADVVFCVGTRTQMMKSGAAFLSGTLKWTQDRVDRVGRSLAAVVPAEGEDMLCGEVFKVDPSCGLLVFVRLDRFEPTVEDISVLSHEICHVTFTLKRHLHVEESGCMEAFCYMQEYLLNKSLKALCEGFMSVVSEGAAKSEDQIGSYGVDFHVVDLGDGKLDATRSFGRIHSCSGVHHPPLTRRQLYRGRREEALCNYTHEFMCMDFPKEPDPKRPSEEEWMGMKPFPWEIDEFLTEKLFREGR